MLRDGEGPTSEHAVSVSGCVQGRVVEVADHSPRLPAAKHTGLKGIDIGSDESHSTTHMEGMGADVLRGNA